VPRPDVEFRRAQLAEELKAHFVERCKNVLQIEAPMLALIRWYNAQLTLAFEKEPIWR
jgi:hypothetical protein